MRFLAAILFPFSTIACAAMDACTVVIETELGRITVALETSKAPRTCENFLRYVDGKFYEGGSFHRTVTLLNQPDNPVKIEVVQASAPEEKESKAFAPIAIERTKATGLRHLAGTISMARDGPDTATHSFFICVTDQPELDFGGKRNPDGQGFAAFGRVVEGMDVVRKIQKAPAKGQELTPAIRIQAIRRL